MNIGFFDSGLGGLIILKAVAKHLPDYDYLYYGDTKNLPYGDKSEEEIFELTKAGVGELFKRDCALVIIACNTASAETLRKLQDDYLINTYPERRILGVIIPTVEAVIESEASEVLLIATTRTVSSEKYNLELSKRVGEKVILYSIATPGLVPLIENQDNEAALLIAEAAITAEISLHAGISTVVLGCTHYTLLKKELEQCFPNLKFISQDEVIPKKLEKYLVAHPEINDRLSRGQSRNIILTEHRPYYDKVAGDLLEGKFIVN